MRFNTETIVGLFVLSSLAVFTYLSFYLGIFNFNKSHIKYYAYFKDVSGMQNKADIKISGVKVGWVDSFKLVKNNLVKVKLMVTKDISLTKDCKTAIKQESFLGSKYIEITNNYNVENPEYLNSGDKISEKNSIVAPSMEDLLLHIKNLTENLEKLTSTEIDIAKNHISRLSSNIEEALYTSKKNFDSSIVNLTDTAKLTCDNINKVICSTGGYIEPTLNFIEKTKNTKILLDSHLEWGPKLTKFYFDTQLYPNNNYFGLLGVRLADSKKTDYTHRYNRWGLNLQLGAIYNPFALKVGVFEGYLGFAGECLIPIYKKINFLASIQAFDFFRTNQINPYLRWLNKIYISPNVYISCGVDNIMNSKYRTGFIGAGVRFSS